MQNVSRHPEHSHLWAFIWLNELGLKANWCIICSTIYFPTEIDMHYVADCIEQWHIFHVFDWKIKSRAVREPLPSHQERCLAPRNRYAASLRPGTVTILQRAIPQFYSTSLIARFMAPTWDPSGADRTRVGPILAPWTLLSGIPAKSRARGELPPPL